MLPPGIQYSLLLQYGILEKLVTYMSVNFLQIEFNKAVKECEIQSTRHATKKGNLEKNQNPRTVPCKKKI